ncbi:hypothetical protein MKW94_023053 [Papaver nudicaule]|uniref:FKB95-like N-terminal Kelch domain-containing protein n=1 Tax=Papaver nudicaule TaxID=74823 RepID=A0AA41VXH4_PAPNU|nr:hypothetical protein [Papaver nudicaule]
MEDSPPSPSRSRDSNLLIPSLPDTNFQNHGIQLLKSPHFFTTRFNLNSIQALLFINIRTPNSSFKWCFLDPKNPKPLFSVPPIPAQSMIFHHQMFGFLILVLAHIIGGCLIDSWSKASHWAEVFDPVVGNWVAVPSPVDVKEKWMHGCAVIGDKVYAMADRGGVVYDTKELSWDVVKTEIDLGWRGRATVVDGVLFCYDYLGKIRGFDDNGGTWREANVGGNLCIYLGAEISIRKSSSSGGELWGSIVWSQVILVVPNSSSLVHCLAVGLFCNTIKCLHIFKKHVSSCVVCLRV